MRARHALASLAVAALCLAVGVALASDAHAKERSTQTEARWIAFDPEAKTVQVKVQKPGKGPNAKMMKSGAEVTFRVKPEGSILTRTSVSINGKKGELGDIPAGKQVNVYWAPDTEQEGAFFARKIDVVLSEEELDALYGAE
jgi:hypothetical protein